MRFFLTSLCWSFVDSLFRSQEYEVQLGYYDDCYHGNWRKAHITLYPHELKHYLFWFGLIETDFPFVSPQGTESLYNLSSNICCTHISAWLILKSFSFEEAAPAAFSFMSFVDAFRCDLKPGRRLCRWGSAAAGEDLAAGGGGVALLLQLTFSPLQTQTHRLLAHHGPRRRPLWHADVHATPVWCSGE